MEICPSCGSNEWLEVPNSSEWICTACEYIIQAPPLDDND